MRLLHPILFISVIFVCVGGYAASIAPTDDPLSAYLGRWAGHYRIHDQASGETKVLPVEQHYWVEDGLYRGLAVVSSESGLVSSSSVIYPAGGAFVTEVERGDAFERFLGSFHDGIMSWYPSDQERAGLYKMEEAIIEVDGLAVLRIEGFDIRESGQEIVEVTYQGALVKQHN